MRMTLGDDDVANEADVRLNNSRALLKQNIQNSVYITVQINYSDHKIASYNTN